MIDYKETKEIALIMFVIFAILSLAVVTQRYKSINIEMVPQPGPAPVCQCEGKP